jgi:hypothetical protein
MADAFAFAASTCSNSASALRLNVSGGIPSLPNTVAAYALSILVKKLFCAACLPCK